MGMNPNGWPGLLRGGQPERGSPTDLSDAAGKKLLDLRWGKGEETWLLASALEQRAGDTYRHARTPARHSITNADWFSPSAKTDLPLGLILALAPNTHDMGQETLCTSLWNGVDDTALTLFHKFKWQRTGSFKAKS